MRCRFCGTQLKEGAAFCANCGQRVAAAAPGVQPTQPVQHVQQSTQPAQPVPVQTKKKPRTLLIVLLCVAGAGVLFAGFLTLLALLNSFREAGEEEREIVTDTQTAANGDERSLQVLLGLMEEAQDCYIELTDVYGDEDTEFDEMVEKSQEAKSQLEELRQKSAALKDLDPEVKEAADDFYETLLAPVRTMEEMAAFYETYVELVNSPILDDYDTIEDHYNDLYAWYEDKKEIVDSITYVPSCVEAEWDNFKENFELNYVIVSKEYLASELEDYLRFASALYLSERYMIAEENNLTEMLMCFDDEVDFATVQEEEADAIASEIEAYAAMDADKRKDYVFTSRRDNEIVLDYDTVDTIYPSLYNTYDAFAIIKTGCISGTHAITVEAEIPGFTQKYKQSFNLDSSYKAIFIKPPFLAGDLDLTAAKDAQINISVYEKDGRTLIESKTFPVKIKSRNDFDWFSDEFGIFTTDNLLCFLTPEARAVADLKRTAIDEISAMTDGMIEGFPGYQLYADEEDVEAGYAPAYLADEYAITYLEAAAILRALNEKGVRYNMDPFSLSGSDQHILLPTQVLEQRSGLCAETALVVASALQSAGMHTFLVMPPGHVQVAVEVWEESGEYYLIETTAVSDAENNREIFRAGLQSIMNEEYPEGPITYLSPEEWSELLDQTDEDGNMLYYIIDCDDSRVLGMTPFAN